MELSYNEQMSTQHEKPRSRFMEEIQLHFREKQSDLRRKLANFEGLFTKLSSVVTSQMQLESQSGKSMEEYHDDPNVNFGLIKPQKTTNLFQSLSKLTEEDMQYFARPTIDRIFALQKMLQEEYNLMTNSSDTQLDERFDEKGTDEEKPARKNLPDPLNSKKIEKRSSYERRKIPKLSLDILRAWLLNHIDDPYPSNQEKNRLANDARLTFKQVHNWFINARGRSCKQLLKREKFSRVVEKKLLDSNPGGALDPVRSRDSI